MDINIEEMLKKTYNGIASKYEKESQIDWENKKYVDLFSKYLGGPNKQVLDIGCGPGILSSYLYHKGYKVQAIDNSENMIKLAKKRNPDVDYRIMNFYDIGQLNKTFDGIVATYILVHIDRNKAEAFINNMAKMLNPQGILFLTFTTSQKEGIQPEQLDNNYYNYQINYSNEELVEMLSRNKLEILENNNEIINDYEIGIIIARKGN